MQDFAQRMDEHARKLREMHTPQATAAPLQALIAQEVARQLGELAKTAPAPRQGHTEQMLMVLLEKNLPPADMAWLTAEHIPAGAPGFVEFLNSETAKTIVQMAFEAYKEFLSGQRK